MKQRLIAKSTTVLQHVPLMRNLARQKFIAHYIIGLINETSRAVTPVMACSGLSGGNKAKKLACRVFRDALPGRDCRRLAHRLPLALLIPTYLQCGI